MTDAPTTRSHPDCQGRGTDPCPLCEATLGDPCALDAMSGPTGAPITAGQPATCNPDDGVCEACQ